MKTFEERFREFLVWKLSTYHQNSPYFDRETTLKAMPTEELITMWRELNPDPYDQAHDILFFMPDVIGGDYSSVVEHLASL
ncbi:MAG TPA: hypothetical protein VFF14_01430 [Candidatus Deferrimicrobium sp.]|nr:hypothetical protein [Candidatus Deferrimicrobium sp.]